MEIEKYFERIEYKNSTDATIATLKALQNDHLLHVPFENIDIHYKVPIELNLRNIFYKVVIRKRGGFCYELNGIFHELLQSIGFNVKMISARVFNQGQQTFSPEFDHMAIIAKIDSSDYLVDVGFGEFAFSPLKIELNSVQIDERGCFMIEKYDDMYYKVARQEGENWVTEYMFSLRQRDLSEFQERCYYNQTSPSSHFTQNKFCSLATKNGRITVAANKIKITEGNAISELPINSEEEFLNALEKYFHIRPANAVQFPVATTA